MTIHHGACALHVGLARLHARTRPPARATTRVRLRTHTRTRLEICNIIAFPQQQWFRERASLLRYSCITSSVFTKESHWALRQARPRTTECRNKECVSVALVIRHAKRMRCIVLSSVASPAVQGFSTLSLKGHDFRGEKILNIKCVFDFSTFWV